MYDDLVEFKAVPGKQHYRLLSVIANQVNNQTIIDIGTHRGQSALSLSYNLSNTIHTFDIEDRVVNTEIRNRENIQFHLENLWEPEIAKKWTPTILQTAFIMLDVDPHNGTMEYDFYQFLKKIGYTGFVICNDIWLFKEMRDNFWYKIPHNEKYDISHLGHYSGTGIISFGESIKFDKYDNSDWTLVTAYFNLTKCPDASSEIKARDQNYYISHAISTLSLPYNLVIYCDNESYDKIREMRPSFLEDKTKYIIREFDEISFTKQGCKLNEKFKDYREHIIKNRKENPYKFDNRNTASYYLFCMARYMMLKETVTNNVFKSSHFGWINFCIERMGYMNVKNLDEALSIKRDKFSTCYIDYIPEGLVRNTSEYFQWGRCGMCSGFFTGNAEYIYKVCDKIEDKFLEYLQEGYGHADEQLYSPVYFENPELFEHYYGDYQEMITNYRYIYDAPNPPIHNFIRNSFNNANYIKCYEACEFVWKSYCMNKCNITNDYLQKLYFYYMNCRRILKKV
jgi:hypothetical protein